MLKVGRIIKGIAIDLFLLWFMTLVITASAAITYGIWLFWSAVIFK